MSELRQSEIRYYRGLVWDRYRHPSLRYRFRAPPSPFKSMHPSLYFYLTSMYISFRLVEEIT